MKPNPLENVLRSLRRSDVGGAVEYAAQFLGGLVDPQLLRSGATPEEERRTLPGDDRVPHPMWEATRAVTIEAPSDDVWPGSHRWGTGAVVSTVGTLWSERTRVSLRSWRSRRREWATSGWTAPDATRPRAPGR
jgi:hypothetical protein